MGSIYSGSSVFFYHRPFQASYSNHELLHHYSPTRGRGITKVKQSKTTALCTWTPNQWNNYNHTVVPLFTNLICSTIWKRWVCLSLCGKDSGHVFYPVQFANENTVLINASIYESNCLKTSALVNEGTTESIC